MRMRPMLRGLALGAACAVAGCSVVEWRKPGFTQADFQRDLAQCDLMVAPEDNIPQPTRPLSGLGLGLTDGEKYCLRGKGWVP
jgi:hypothetical protein